jgi:type VI secretion system VasD/TssJ family lipoprotein
MHGQPQGGRFLGLAVLLLALAVMPGCAASKKLLKGGLKVTLTAAPECNSCGKASGYPLQYRVLQVTDASVISGLSLTQLWDKEDKLLGKALLEKREAFIDPGKTSALSLERKPGATAMIVVGNFCRGSGTCWYHVQPFSQGGSVKLLAGSDCFTVAK